MTGSPGTIMISILMVDDDIELLNVCKLYLEESGEFVVDTSLSTTEALNRVQEKSYDAIIVDYMMPDLDALQFLRLFRQSDPVTPFIIFTGKGREEVAIQAFEGGADHYLQKGENPEEQFSLLREKIIQAYTKRVFEEEIRRQDRLLTAIAECTWVLLQEKKINLAIQKVLGIIGPATDQDRIYLFKAHSDPVTNEFLVSQQYEWCNNGVSPQIDNPDLQNLPFQMVAPYSNEMLKKGKMVSCLVKNLPESEREILGAQGIISILLVPIVINKEFCGFIGFDNCRTEYEWSNGEKETLLTLANAIGTAINRASVNRMLEETNVYLENLITNASGPIIVWDTNFQITMVNKACERLAGRDADDLVNKSIKELFPGEVIREFQDRVQVSETGDFWNTLEIPVKNPDGSIRHVIWNISVIFSPGGNKQVATIAQGLDITENRRLEEEKEEAINQIKMNFAQQSVLNDGIRNPLTVILGYAEYIEDLKIKEMIFEPVKQIDNMVRQLDHRWNESDKILQYLQKHHNVIVERRIPYHGDDLQRPG